MKLNLKNRFLFSTLLLLLLGMSVTTLISYIISKKSLDEAYQSQITQLARSTSDIIATWIRDRQLDVKNWSGQTIYQAALNKPVAGPSARKASNRQLAKLKEDYKYYENICIANADGDTISAADSSVVGALNVAGETYYQEALNGRHYTSDVMQSNHSGNPVFIIAHPIKEKDQIKGVFFGVLDLGFISQNYIEPVKIGQKGYAYLYQKDGTIIAHPDRQHVLKLNMGKFDFGRRMLAKGYGTIIYTFKGMEKIVAFKTDQVQGWTVAVGAATSDLMAPIKRFGTISLVAGLVVVFMAAMITFLIAKSIVKGINVILRAMRRSITQIAANSTQLYGSSHQLAEGASEQAASIEETSSSLEEMASMTRQNSENALQADNLMKKTNQVVAQTYGSMDQLMNSMVDISQASEETSKIIKTIDEIAFQTNLLALNAAVEAARAGEAGAGFAVVADEVRNLAMRAADAAKNTAELIEGTVNKIKEVSDLGTQTHGGFSEVADHSSKVGGLVAEIAAASKEQAQGIEQVNQAVAAMDKVVQQNAASAQESASSSEEMTAQASQMEEMVARLLVLVAGSRKTAVGENAPGNILERTAIHGTASEKAQRPVPGSRPMNAARAVPAEFDEFEDF